MVFVGDNLQAGGGIELIRYRFSFSSSCAHHRVVTEFTLLPELVHLRQATKHMRTLMESRGMEGDAEQTISFYETAFDHLSSSFLSF